ncbi:hypothetical protein [[Mycobacterium] holstebronense]|uniref:DUF3558 domain-containing protein n=1 Tax=[Mycobacterium] holstebronense TaxID=3064288 RepID=A0ABM9LYL5_9MYCO|nr:hypothetical protein [Mycolicibacter sp. MU0102]CAJ1507003.1 hypothetical protein MU0102_002925 [Mycolicibacter sp. MU0102]
MRTAARALSGLAAVTTLVGNGIATGLPPAIPAACDLLSSSMAREFAGTDAERQLWLDADPPVPLGDSACQYSGSAGTVFVSLNPMPTNPDAPINHFSVVRPENAIPDLGYQAYWFGAGQSLVVVKEGLLLQIKVSDNANPAGAQPDQDHKNRDIALANQIVPELS